MRQPKLYRKKNKMGRFVGNWIAKVRGDEVNLGTKDAELARRHLRQALEQGRREFSDEIDEAAAALPDVAAAPPAPPAAPAAAPPAAPAATAAAPPAAPAAPAAPMLLPPVPAAASAEDFADTQDAAGEAAGAGPEAFGGDAAGAGGGDPEVVEITDDELAKLGVEAQVWVAAAYARSKVYKGFITPATPEELRAPLVTQWRKILAYAGVAAALPPWVTGLVIPGVTLVTSTFAMAGAFAAIAEEQRKAAGAPSQASEAAAT